MLFNATKKDDDIKKIYPEIQRIEFAEKYTSNKVERISLKDLKQIILNSGFLEN